MLSIQKSNISWLNKLLIILLIVGIVSIAWVFNDSLRVFFFPEPANPNQANFIKTDSIATLGEQLVNKYVSANIQTKKRNNILQAVNNSLQHLLQTGHHQALQLLQTLELKASIDYLIEAVKQEEKSRDAAKLWIDIGNLQQLQSSQLVFYAYKKASQLDDKNSNAWNRLGHYYRQQKQFSLAENAYSKVLQVSIDATTTQAVALANFGLLYQAQGKLDKAEASYLKALTINAAKKNRSSSASNSENLAIIYKNNNNFELSEKYYLEALEHYKSLKQTNAIASVCASLASLYHHYQHLDKAKEYYQIALKIYQANDNKKKIANAYSNLGILYQQQGSLDKATDFFQKSLEINQKIKQQQGIANQYGNLGVLYRLQKKFTQSESFHLRSLSLYQKLKHSEGVSQQQTNLGFLYQAWGQTGKACQYWQESKQTLVLLHNKNRIERISQLIEKHCEINK